MSSLFSGLGKVKEKAFSGLESLGKIPDRPKKAWQRKALYIVFDLGVVFLAFGMLSTSVGVGLHPLHWFSASNLTAIQHGLSNPGYGTLLSLPMIFGGAAAGMSWTLSDIIPKKYHRHVTKTMAVVAPLLMLGGSLALMASGGIVHGAHGAIRLSFTKAMTSQMFYYGLLLLPASLYVALQSKKTLERKNIPIFNGSDSGTRPRARRRNQQRRPRTIEMNPF